MASTWDIVGKVIDAGANLYSTYEKDQARDKTEQAIRDREQFNYDQAKGTHDAYIQYAQGLAGQSAGNAAAAAAAHAAGQQAKLAANADAQRVLQEQYALANQALDPYAKMGQRLIVPVEATYKAGLGGLQDLQKAVMTGENMAQLGAPSTPLNQIYANLPQWMTNQ